MLASTFYVFWKSESRNMYKMLDSSGNDCGEGEAEDFPFLLMQSVKSPYKSVCVKKCPQFDYNEMKYNSTGDLKEPKEGEDSFATNEYIKASTPLNFVEFDMKFAGKSSTHTLDMSQKEIFGFDEGFANDYFSKGNWENYLQSFEMECLPNKQFENCKYESGKFWVYDTYEFLGTICVPLQPKTALHFYKISSKINHGMVGDIQDSKVLFLYVFLIALAMSLVFMVFTRFCGTFVMWVLTVVTILVLILGGILLLTTYYYEGPLHEKANHLKIKYLSFLLSHKILFHVVAIGMILAGFFVLYLVIKNRKEISSSLPLLGIAAQCSLSNFLLIILSIVILILQICVFFFEIYVIVRILSMGDGITHPEDGSPFVKYQTTFSKILLISLHSFGTYWLLIFLNNFNDFITTAITVNFYFGTNIKNLNIFCHSLGHHSGSVAWTIILLPVLILKTLFWPFKWCFSSDNPNALQNKVNSCCNSCCMCYEYIIDSICENFMALTYMGSEGFFFATRRYFYLSQKYIQEHRTATFLSFLYNSLARMLIGILSGYFGILIYRGNLHLQQNVKYVGVVFGLCFFLAFVVGSLFINLFSTAYDTIVICYLVETNLFERNDGQYQIKANLQIKDTLKSTIDPNTDSYVKLLNR